MRLQFLLLPAAIITSAPAFAENYLTVPQAQALIFPGAKFTPADFDLDDGQIVALMNDSQVPLWRRKVKAWKVSTGGWFFLDQVIGLEDHITYALGVDKDGAVKGIEILTCLELYGGIRKPEWRAQFLGKRHGKIDLLDQIALISGSSLSTAHVAEGVKRLLATYALFLAPKAS